MSDKIVSSGLEKRGICTEPADIDKLKHFLELVFQGPQEYQGLVTIVCGNKKGVMKPAITAPACVIGEKIKELVIYKNRNYYITKGQTKNAGHWRDKDLFCLNAMYIDIDNHTVRRSFLRKDYFDENEIVRRIYSDLVNADLILEPNIVVYTGRGIHLVWLIDQAAADLKGLYRFVCAQYCHMISEIVDAYNKEAHTKLSVDKACSQKVMGLTRLPETFNAANGERCSFRVLHERRMDLAREFDTQLGRAEMRGYHPDSVKKQRRKRRTGGNSKAAGKARVDALLKLKEQRGDDMEGYRAKFLLILFSALEMSGLGKEEALKQVIAVDSSFRRSLGPRKVKGYLSSAMRKSYRFTNHTIISWLDITPKEQKRIGFGEARKRTSKEKNAARDRRAANRRSRRNHSVIRYWEAGFSKSEIARRVHISRNTVASIIKKYVMEQETKRTAKEKKRKESQKWWRRQAKMRRRLWKVSARLGGTDMVSPLSAHGGTIYRAPPLEDELEEES